MSTNKHNLLLHRTFQYLGIILIMAAIGGGYWYWKNAQAGVTQKAANNQGLVGYWSFDEGTGTKAGDASGNANTGTLTNMDPATDWVDGRLGKALDFDGTNDYADAGSGNSLRISGALSMSFWMYGRGSSTDAYIAGTAGTNLEGYSCTHHNGATVYCYLQSGSNYVSAAVGTNTWAHIVFTWDGTTGTNGKKLYVNGVLQSQGTSTQSVLSGWGNFRVGEDATATRTRFNGKVDELRVFNRALEAAEITNLYSLGAAKLQKTQSSDLTNGLVGYWPFNGKDVSGTTAYDRSGQGNNGTLTNGPTVTEGRSGQALNFDGADDYVSISDNASLSPTAQMTVSVWINRTENIYLNDRDIISKSQSGSRSWGTNARADGGFNFYVANVLTDTGSNYASTAANLIQQGAWTHLMFVFDGSGSGNADRAKIYVNGVQQVLTFTGTISASLQDSIGPVVIGDNEYGGYHRMKGYVDEPRIYNRALSAGEIWDLYQLGNPDHVNAADSQGDSLEKGLVGYWKLDDASGTSATDASGNGNTGTLTNGPTWTTGQIGGATDFDGTDDYITASHNAVLNAYPITVSGWIQTSTVDAGTTSRGMVGKYRSGSGDGYLIYLYQGHARAWYFRNSSNYVYDGAQGLDGGFVSDGIWHNVVLKVDASGGELYVDGVKKDSRAWTGTPGAMAATQPFCIGMFSTTADCTAGTFYSGKTDEVRIYNRALSVDEISRLYKQTAPDNPDTGLVGYWPFNGPDVSGTTAYDRSGKGNNGTLTNGPTVTEGKAGQSILLDGSNDYVSIGTNLSSFVTTEFTVSAWVRPTLAPAGVGRVAVSTYDWDSVPANERGWTLGNNYGSETYFLVTVWDASGATASASNPGFFSNYLNDWKHVTGVFKGGQYLKLYIDGILSSEDTTSVPSSVAYNAATNIRIGARADNNSQGNWHGKIDEVRIYNRALSGAEITALYDAGR